MFALETPHADPARLTRVGGRLAGVAGALLAVLLVACMTAFAACGSSDNSGGGSKSAGGTKLTAIKKDPALEAVRRLHSSRYLAIDMTSFFCSARFCPPVIGGVLVYKDLTHITSEYAKTLAPYLEREIRRLKIKSL